jgi:hypothetical protein
MSRELPTLPQRSPHIPRPIDNTALDAFMRCPRLYYYSMVLNRRQRHGSSLSPALAYGTTWHSIMEAHYKTGGDTQAIVDTAVRSWKNHENAEDHRTLERCITEYNNFLKFYGSFEQETAGWGQTVGWPDTPVIEIPIELWWPGALHPYTGKIDRVFQHQGLYYVEDHKTCSALGATYFRQFDPSNQMMGYAWLAQLQTGFPIAGVRISAHCILKASSKFQRETIMFSQERLKEWGKNYNEWVKRLEEAHQRLEIGDQEIAALQAFPHNFNACATKYGQCTYTEVCTFDATMRERILEAEFEEQPWNPLQPDEGE